jgi:hypothetical protein
MGLRRTYCPECHHDIWPMDTNGGFLIDDLTPMRQTR